MQNLTKLHLEVLLKCSTEYVLPFILVLHALLEHRVMRKLELSKVVLYTFCFYLYDITASGLCLTQIGCDVGEVQVNLSAGIIVQ